MTDDIIKSLVIDFQPLPDVKPEKDAGIRNTEDAVGAALFNRVNLINSVKMLQRIIDIDADKDTPPKQIANVTLGGSTYSLNGLKQVQDVLTDAYLGTGPEYRMSIALDGKTLATFDVVTQEEMDRATLVFVDAANEVGKLRSEKIQQMLGYVEASSNGSPLVSDHMVQSGLGELPAQLSNRAREVLAEKFLAAEAAARQQS